jgi:teichoic acid transport system permease protein
VTWGAEAAHAWQPQPNDETILMPALTTEIPVVVPPPQSTIVETPPSLTELADRHGLIPAGSRPRLREYTGQLWRYRHFIASFANARLAASFTTARLGRLWQVLTPLTNAAVYYLIFGVVLNTRDGVPNFIAYLCTGLFVFTFTQTVVLSGVQAISGQLGLVRALQFPRACLPIALTLTHLQTLAVSVAVLVGIVLVTGEPVSLRWLYLIPALALQSLFNVGLALAVARLGAKITDLRQLMPYVMRTWMYGSGVFYSVQFFADHLPPTAATLVRLNPMLVYIELARDALLATPPLASSTLQLWLLGAGWAVLACLGGYVYFWRGEPEYGRG